MPTRSILDRLSGGEVLLMDGATGSELERRGVNLAKGASTTRTPVHDVQRGDDQRDSRRLGRPPPTSTLPAWSGPYTKTT